MSEKLPLHPATEYLVVRGMAAVRDKLARAEQKYGYRDGWLSPNWMSECRAKMYHHITKGDPLDVIAYCLFLWHHDASTCRPGFHIELLDAYDVVLDRRDLFEFARSAIEYSLREPRYEGCDMSGVWYLDESTQRADEFVEKIANRIQPVDEVASSVGGEGRPVAMTAQAALAAIETFEIVGDNNDSREPNSDDRFILTEFIAHAYGGFAVEPIGGSPADDLASMTRMFHAACGDLGMINEALGLDPNDGGAAPIIAEINALKARASGTSDRESTIAEILCVLDGMIKRGDIAEPAHSERNGIVMAFNVVAELNTENRAPVFVGRHVSLNQEGKKIFVTLEFDGIEGAPHYAVTPINPCAVRSPTASHQTDPVGEWGELREFVERENAAAREGGEHADR